jgi:hypothetical protein
VDQFLLKRIIIGRCNEEESKDTSAKPGNPSRTPSHREAEVSSQQNLPDQSITHRYLLPAIPTPRNKSTLVGSFKS